MLDELDRDFHGDLCVSPVVVWNEDKLVVLLSNSGDGEESVSSEEVHGQLVTVLTEKKPLSPGLVVQVLVAVEMKTETIQIMNVNFSNLPSVF